MAYPIQMSLNYINLTGTIPENSDSESESSDCSSSSDESSCSCSSCASSDSDSSSQTSFSEDPRGFKIPPKYFNLMQLNHFNLMRTIPENSDSESESSDYSSSSSESSCSCSNCASSDSDSSSQAPSNEVDTRGLDLLADIAERVQQTPSKPPSTAIYTLTQMTAESHQHFLVIGGISIPEAIMAAKTLPGGIKRKGMHEDGSSNLMPQNKKSKCDQATI